MTLNTRDRSILFESLSKLADPEAVDAMLAHFPTRAVDEPLDATQCGGKENCHDEHRCMTHDLWATLNFKMYEYLSSVSLHDLVTRNAHKVVDVLPIKDQRVGPRPRAKIMAVGV